MIYLQYFIYALINGHTEAFLYSRKGADALPVNEHAWFVCERFLFGSMAGMGVLYAWLFGVDGAAFLAMGEGLSAALAFSFLRDGFYNLMRDRIGKTNHGWRYSSPTDSSKINFNYRQRLAKFAASLVLMALTYTLYLFA